MKSEELRKYLKGDMLLVLEATGAAATIELMRPWWITDLCAEDAD
jgi:hypothetical protein